MVHDHGAGAVLFQDCQFFVYKAIDIKSIKVGEIRMANCFISAMTENIAYNSDPVIDSLAEAVFTVWNVTIYVNNAFYTCGNEDFGHHIGSNIVVRETVFASGTTHFKL